jgi:DNA invertase Pin-like site-specific DNA recombinase
MRLGRSRVRTRLAAGGKRIRTAGPTCDRDVEIAVLGGLADVERDLIRTRTAEGRNRAQKQKRGQHMGRPPRMTS